MISSNRFYYKRFAPQRVMGIAWIICGLLTMISSSIDWSTGLLVCLIGVVVLLFSILNKARFRVVEIDDNHLNIFDGKFGIRNLKWTDVLKIKRRLTLNPTYKLVLKNSNEDILFFSDWGKDESHSGFNWKNKMGEIIERKSRELRW